MENVRYMPNGMETGEIRMEKSEKKMSKGMKVLSGLTIVSGAAEGIYRVAGELGAERAMSWQVWVVTKLLTRQYIHLF